MIDHLVASVPSCMYDQAISWVISEVLSLMYVWWYYTYNTSQCELVIY